MDYKSGIANLPKELITKLIKMTAFQDAFLSKKLWSEEMLDKLFEDASKELRPKEQEQFYDAFLKDITFATYSEWLPKIKTLKKLSEKDGNITSTELSQKALEVFPPKSSEYKEVKKLNKDIQNVIIILCNTQKALHNIQRTPKKELQETVEKVLNLADDANIFNTMITLFEGCENIVRSYNKPPPSGNKNKFGY